jgi:nucleoside 2-deoxyribosyltransferase
MSDVCFVCLNTPVEIEIRRETDDLRVQCSRCGTYQIDRKAQLTLEHLTEDGTKRHLLGGVVRENSDRGNHLLLTVQNIPDLISAARPPRTPFDAIDRLLLYIFDQAESPTSYVRLKADTDYPLIHARSGNDLAFYLYKAKGLGYIETLGSEARLDLDGWQRVDELRRTRVLSNQAFVAMWFKPEVRDAWTDGIEPALSATGYIPIRLDFVEHNERIDDRIISEIRRSGLLVADFTGDRGGVYFEAGFALGLGIPVIWTCREDYVESLHFDTRQYNYIAWSNPADLREKLELRIRATIPNHPNAGTNV